MDMPSLRALQLRLQTALRPQDVFGVDIAAGYVRLAKVCHPDLFAAGSREQALAETLFKQLEAWRGMGMSPPRAVSPDEEDALPRELASPTRAYTLTRLLGTGDLCRVYLAHASSDDGRYVVKVPRGVGGGRLLAREFEVVSQLARCGASSPYRQYFPQPVESFRRDRQRIGIYGLREGYVNAEEIRGVYPGGVDGRHVAWMFNRMLEAIGFVHQSGWLHGAPLPPHLLFHPRRHGLQMVGLAHALQPGDVLEGAPAKYIHWYPPECRGRRPATPAMDIYLAVRSALYLAGGDDAAPPAHVPARMQRFFRGCLQDSPAMRPQSAWKLLEEFRDLLEDIYGPPQFVPLEMPRGETAACGVP